MLVNKRHSDQGNPSVLIECGCSSVVLYEKENRSQLRFLLGQLHCLKALHIANWRIGCSMAFLLLLLSSQVLRDTGRWNFTGRSCDIIYESSAVFFLRILDRCSATLGSSNFDEEFRSLSDKFARTQDENGPVEHVQNDCNLVVSLILGMTVLRHTNHGIPEDWPASTND
mmetsp:Transcript_6090/g.9491  ORF Transcript_6090/g.9491 Transcript_6090/m.9491 type:complete len:170 (-) Transcript_6090:810-1319(-)